MTNHFEQNASARNTLYGAELLRAKVRINETFCSDRDLSSVTAGRIIYPDQLRLDWVPVTVAIGASVLELNDDLQVLRVWQ